MSRIIVYDDTEEHHELENRIAQVQRDERCVQRVTSVTAFSTLVAMAGLAYVAILGEDFSYTQSQIVVTVFCILGLTSLICLVSFAALLAVYRRRLNRMRRECRRLVTSLLEPHPGNFHVTNLRNGSSESGDREIAHNSAKVNGSVRSLGSLRESGNGR